MSRSFSGFVAETNTNSQPFKRDAKSLVILGRTEGIDEFFDPLLEGKYECPICLLGLRDPVQTQCGHRFCKNCIVRSLRDAGNKCPVDNVPLTESGLYPDNFAKREMNMFMVWCRFHKERNCPWKGHLKDLEDHLEDCEFVDVTCPNNCGTEVQRKYYKEHIKNCPMRKVKCEHCKNQVLFTTLQLHYSECPKYPINCEKCSKEIVREKMPQHRERECTKEKIKCPLSFLGCKEENFIPEINKHLANTLSSHMHDIAKAVKDNQDKANQASARALVAPGPSYTTYTEERLLESQKAPPDLKRLSDRVTKLETRLIDLEGRVCSGTFIWKVDQYDQSRMEAVNNLVSAIHSPPFYTSLYGYKLCLRMNLNGVDSGVGRHLSLFVHMMQGDWDDILEWPFTGRITLAVLDQSENVDFRRPISETLVAKPNLLAFQKPTAARNHKGYGYVEFCQIDQLVLGQYIKNNCMLVRIQVFH